MFLITQKDQLF